jgi:NAD(P)-dependent dehydrogenase (short-subunit alcohol dehydrogenase family)
MDAGKVAIVTGAGRGIGAATVQRLSLDGWRVTAADLDGPAADAIAGATGGIGIACDVASEADIDGLIDAVLGAHGRIDAVVSNAGIGTRGPLGSLTLET